MAVAGIVAIHHVIWTHMNRSNMQKIAIGSDVGGIQDMCVNFPVWLKLSSPEVKIAQIPPKRHTFTENDWSLESYFRLRK